MRLRTSPFRPFWSPPSWRCRPIACRRAGNAQDEHFGGPELALRRCHRHLCAGSRQTHQRPLQGPEFLRRCAGRGARIHRRRPARHARPHADVDGPDTQISCPNVAILDIPFLFRDYAQARAVLDGPIGQEMLQKFPPKGIVALAWAENGFRHMTNSKRAVNGPDDLEGPQDANDGESDSHTGVQAIRHPANADGVHRGVHRVAAGHRRRSGESALGDHGGEARSGAERT